MVSLRDGNLNEAAYRWIEVERMRFEVTRIPGVFVVELEPLEDERGFFARSWCPEVFEANHLNPRLLQCSISFNRKKGTIRGMHYQAPPHAEAKLVRATRGAVYDVALDLRRDSPAFMRWFAAELSTDNHRALYIPEGCAHGFQTLEDGSEVFYQISAGYHPESSGGVRFDDPAFAIVWPLEVAAVSKRDREFEQFRP